MLKYLSLILSALLFITGCPDCDDGDGDAGVAEEVYSLKKGVGPKGAFFVDVYSYELPKKLPEDKNSVKKFTAVSQDLNKFYDELFEGSVQSEYASVVLFTSMLSKKIPIGDYWKGLDAENANKIIATITKLNSLYTYSLIRSRKENREALRAVTAEELLGSLKWLTIVDDINQNHADLSDPKVPSMYSSDFGQYLYNDLSIFEIEDPAWQVELENLKKYYQAAHDKGGNSFFDFEIKPAGAPSPDDDVMNLCQFAYFDDESIANHKQFEDILKGGMPYCNHANRPFTAVKWIEQWLNKSPGYEEGLDAKVAASNIEPWVYKWEEVAHDYVWDDNHDRDSSNGKNLDDLARKKIPQKYAPETVSRKIERADKKTIILRRDAVNAYAKSASQAGSPPPIFYELRANAFLLDFLVTGALPNLLAADYDAGIYPAFSPNPLTIETQKSSQGIALEDRIAKTIRGSVKYKAFSVIKKPRGGGEEKKKDKDGNFITMSKTKPYEFKFQEIGKTNFKYTRINYELFGKSISKANTNDYRLDEKSEDGQSVGRTTHLGNSQRSFYRRKALGAPSVADEATEIFRSMTNGLTPDSSNSKYRYNPKSTPSRIRYRSNNAILFDPSSKRYKKSMSLQKTRALLAISHDKPTQIIETLAFFEKFPDLLMQEEYQVLFEKLVFEPGLFLNQLQISENESLRFLNMLFEFVNKKYEIYKQLSAYRSLGFILAMNNLMAKSFAYYENLDSVKLPENYKSPFMDSAEVLLAYIEDQLPATRGSDEKDPWEARSLLYLNIENFYIDAPNLTTTDVKRLLFSSTQHNLLPIRQDKWLDPHLEEGAKRVLRESYPYMRQYLKYDEDEVLEQTGQDILSEVLFQVRPDLKTSLRGTIQWIALTDDGKIKTPVVFKALLPKGTFIEFDISEGALYESGQIQQRFPWPISEYNNYISGIPPEFVTKIGYKTLSWEGEQNGEPGFQYKLQLGSGNDFRLQLNIEGKWYELMLETKAGNKSDELLELFVDTWKWQHVPGDEEADAGRFVRYYDKKTKKLLYLTQNKNEYEGEQIIRVSDGAVLHNQGDDNNNPESPFKFLYNIELKQYIFIWLKSNFEEKGGEPGIEHLVGIEIPRLGLKLVPKTLSNKNKPALSCANHNDYHIAENPYFEALGHPITYLHCEADDADNNIQHIAITPIQNYMNSSDSSLSVRFAIQREPGKYGESIFELTSYKSGESDKLEDLDERGGLYLAYRYLWQQDYQAARDELLKFEYMYQKLSSLDRHILEGILYYSDTGGNDPKENGVRLIAGSYLLRNDELFGSQKTSDKLLAKITAVYGEYLQTINTMQVGWLPANDELLVATAIEKAAKGALRSVGSNLGRDFEPLRSQNIYRGPEVVATHIDRNSPDAQQCLTEVTDNQIMIGITHRDLLDLNCWDAKENEEISDLIAKLGIQLGDNSKSMQSVLNTYEDIIGEFGYCRTQTMLSQETMSEQIKEYPARQFLHAIGDVFGSKTGEEGNHSHINIKHRIKLLKVYAAITKKTLFIAPEMSNPCQELVESKNLDFAATQPDVPPEVLEELVAQNEFALKMADAAQESAVKAQSVLKQELERLPHKESLFFPIGWSKHAVVSQIIKQDNGLYTFRIFNSGAGIGEYHLRVASGHKIGGAQKVFPYVEQIDISLEKVTSLVFLRALREITNSEDIEKDGKWLYANALSLLDGKRSEAINRPVDALDAQRAGTCSYYSLPWVLGSSITQMKASGLYPKVGNHVPEQIEFFIGLATLRDYSGLISKIDDFSPADLGQAQRVEKEMRLLKKGTDYFAAHVLEMSNNHILGGGELSAAARVIQKTQSIYETQLAGYNEKIASTLEDFKIDHLLDDAFMPPDGLEPTVELLKYQRMDPIDQDVVSGTLGRLQYRRELLKKKIGVRADEDLLEQGIKTQSAVGNPRFSPAAAWNLNLESFKHRFESERKEEGNQGVLAPQPVLSSEHYKLFYKLAAKQDINNKADRAELNKIFRNITDIPEVADVEKLSYDEIRREFIRIFYLTSINDERNENYVRMGARFLWQVAKGTDEGKGFLDASIVGNRLGEYKRLESEKAELEEKKGEAEGNLRTAESELDELGRTKSSDDWDHTYYSERLQEERAKPEESKNDWYTEYYSNIISEIEQRRREYPGKKEGLDAKIAVFKRDIENKEIEIKIRKTRLENIDNEIQEGTVDIAADIAFDFGNIDRTIKIAGEEYVIPEAGLEARIRKIPARLNDKELDSNSLKLVDGLSEDYPFTGRNLFEQTFKLRSMTLSEKENLDSNAESLKREFDRPKNVSDYISKEFTRLTSGVNQQVRKEDESTKIIVLAKEDKLFEMMAKIYQSDLKPDVAPYMSHIDRLEAYHDYEQVLRDEARGKLKEEIGTLREEILSLVKDAPMTKFDSAQRDLFESTQLKKEVAINDVIYLLLTDKMSGFYKLNSGLNAEQIENIYEKTAEYLLLSTQLVMADNAFNAVAAVAEYASQEKTEAPEFKNLLKGAVKALEARRHFNYKEHLEYLVFEHYMKSLLREAQVLALDQLKIENGEVAHGGLLEMIMGAGKTSVLLPILSALNTKEDRLNMIVIPEPLLASMSIELQGRLSGGFGRGVDQFKIERGTRIDAIFLETWLTRFENNRLNKTTVVTTNSSIQSFFLHFIERLAEGNDGDEVTLFREIFDFFRTYGFLTIDEVDLALDVLKAHQFSMGKRQKMPEEITGTIFAFYRLLAENKDLMASFSLPFLNNLSTAEPLTAASYAHVFKEAIVDRIVDTEQFAIRQNFFRDLGKGDFSRSFEEFMSLSGNPQILKDYLLNNRPGVDHGALRGILDAAIEKLDKNSHQEILKNMFAILFEEVDKFFLLTATKKNGIHYGLYPEPVRDPEESNEKFEIREKAYRQNEFIAIPYHAGVPQVNSRFGTEIEQLNYTMQLSLARLDYADLVEKEVKALIKLSGKPAEARRYNFNNRALLLFGGKAQGLTQLDHSDFVDIARRITANQEIPLMLNLVQKYVMAQMFSYKLQLQTNAQIYQELFKNVQGFTGTLWSYETFPTIFKDPVAEGTLSDTSERTLFLLWQQFQDEKSNSATYKEILSISSDDSIVENRLSNLISQVYDNWPSRGSLLDQAGIFRAFSNIDVVKAILSHSDVKKDPNILGAVYYDDEGQLKVLVKQNFAVESIESTTVPMVKRIAYWDKPHTTGSDIKMRPDMEAKISFDHHIFSRDLQQTVWRLRGLAEGQKIKQYFALEDDLGMVRKKLEQLVNIKIDSNSDFRLADLILYSVATQEKKLSELKFRAFKQKLKNIVIEGFASQAFSEDVSNRQLLGTYAQYREFFEKNSNDNYARFMGNANQELSKRSAVELEKIRIDGLIDRAGLGSGERAILEDAVNKLGDAEIEGLPNMIVISGRDDNEEVEIELELEEEKEEENEVEQQRDDYRFEKDYKAHERLHFKRDDASGLHPFSDGFYEVGNIENIALPESLPQPIVRVTDAIGLQVQKEEAKWRGKDQKIVDDFTMLWDAVSENLLMTLNFAPLHYEGGWNAEHYEYNFFQLYHKSINNILIIEHKEDESRFGYETVRDMSPRNSMQLMLLDEDDSQYFEEILRNEHASDHAGISLPKELRNRKIALYNLQKGIIRQGLDPVNADKLKNNEEFLKLLTQVKFLAGSLYYTDEEAKALKAWFNEKGNEPDKFYHLFVFEILNYHKVSRENYDYSTIADIFKDMVNTENYEQDYRKKFLGN